MYNAIFRRLTRLSHHRSFRVVFDAIPVQLKHRVRGFLTDKSMKDIPEHKAPFDSLMGGLSSRSYQVSVVIPVFNHADYLEQCIASALDQDYPNLEVIIIDDCSTDPRVPGILEKFVGHPKLRLFRNDKNRGICITQNSLLTLAKGEFIAFLDCDDWMAREAISLAMKSALADSVFIHSGRVNIDAEGKEIDRLNFKGLPRKNYLKENLASMFATHLKVVRRDAFGLIGVFDKTFDSAQDYEHLMRMSFYFSSTRFRHFAEHAYYHRMHGKQTSETSKKRQEAATDLVRSETMSRLKLSLEPDSAAYAEIRTKTDGPTGEGVRYFKPLQTVHAVSEVGAACEYVFFPAISGPGDQQWLLEAFTLLMNRPALCAVRLADLGGAYTLWLNRGAGIEPLRHDIQVPEYQYVAEAPADGILVRASALTQGEIALVNSVEGRPVLRCKNPETNILALPAGSFQPVASRISGESASTLRTFS